MLQSQLRPHGIQQNWRTWKSRVRKSVHWMQLPSSQCKWFTVITWVWSRAEFSLDTETRRQSVETICLSTETSLNLNSNRKWLVCCQNTYVFKLQTLGANSLKGKNSLPLGANSFLFEKFPFWKRTQLKRTTARSSSLPLMCVTFSALWLRHCACTAGYPVWLSRRGFWPPKTNTKTNGKNVVISLLSKSLIFEPLVIPCPMVEIGYQRKIKNQ